MRRVDRRGVIAHVEVAPAYRRRRMATILTACAVSRGPRFQWSTVPVVNTLKARTFCVLRRSAPEFVRVVVAPTVCMDAGEPCAVAPALDA